MSLLCLLKKHLQLPNKHPRNDSRYFLCHNPPYQGPPINKGADNSPTLGRYQPKPLERAHATDPLADQTFADGSSTSRPTSLRMDTDRRDDGRESLTLVLYRGIFPHPDTLQHRRKQGTGERNATATACGRHLTGTKNATGRRLTYPALQSPPPPQPAAKPTPPPPPLTPAPPVAPSLQRLLYGRQEPSAMTAPTSLKRIGG